MDFLFRDDITLENAFVRLRPICLADCENLLEVATQDKNLLQYSPAPIHSEELLQKYILKSIADRQNMSCYTFSVFDKTKNTHAGSTSYLNISNADSRLEIGATWYGKAFHRTGLNRNCKFLLLEHAFDTLGAERVEFKTDERNLASRRAIEKIGAQFEGILRSHTLLYDGFRRNTVYYSILKPEWEGMKTHFLAQQNT
jgi:RimJ/RimL family protein N-acetyltransferase